MNCEHGLAEMETACADGLCPDCLHTQLAAALSRERLLRETVTNLIVLLTRTCDTGWDSEIKVLKRALAEGEEK